jgi:hypothetical protein
MTEQWLFITEAIQKLLFCFCTAKSLLTLKIIDKENTFIKSEDIIKEIAEELVKGQSISDVDAYRLIYESAIIDELLLLKECLELINAMYCKNCINIQRKCSRLKFRSNI